MPPQEQQQLLPRGLSERRSRVLRLARSASKEGERCSHTCARLFRHSHQHPLSPRTHSCATTAEVLEEPTRVEKKMQGGSNRDYPKRGGASHARKKTREKGWALV